MMAVLVNLVWMYITYTQIATKIDLRDATETNSCVSLIFSISHAMRNQIYQFHFSIWHANLQISTEEGRALSRQMNADAFVECSALSGQNLREVFQEAAKAAVNWQFQTIDKKKRCTIS